MMNKELQTVILGNIVSIKGDFSVYVHILLPHIALVL